MKRKVWQQWVVVGAITLASIAVLVVSGGCGGGGSASGASTTSKETLGRTIPYPEGIELGGAAAYNHANDHLDSRYFATGNDWYTQEQTSTLKILTGFATYQQTTEYTCGPAAILMVRYHYGDTEVTEQEIAEAVEVNDTTGTSVEAVRDYFADLGWQVESHVSVEEHFADPNEFSAFVWETLSEGAPILVNWTRWNGHWELIIGIDTMGTEDAADDVLIMADPYDTTDHNQDGYFVVGMEQFYYEWHEGLCAGKTEPYQQSYIVAHP